MIELPPLRYGKSTPLRWNAPPEDWVSLTSVEARERILQARIAEQDETLRHLGSACDKFRLRIAELERLWQSAEARYAEADAAAMSHAKRIAELEADAERYRWLRDPKRLEEASEDSGNADRAWFIGESGPERWGIAGEDADAAIDAARKA